METQQHIFPEYCDFTCKILLYIQNNLCLEHLEEIYSDKKKSLHLWEKFVYYDRNLLTFIEYLDNQNRKLFLDSINKKI